MGHRLGDYTTRLGGTHVGHSLGDDATGLSRAHVGHSLDLGGGGGGADRDLGGVHDEGKGEARRKRGKEKRSKC